MSLIKDLEECIKRYEYAANIPHQDLDIAIEFKTMAAKLLDDIKRLRQAILYWENKNTLDAPKVYVAQVVGTLYRINGDVLEH